MCKVKIIKIVCFAVFIFLFISETFQHEFVVFTNHTNNFYKKAERVKRQVLTDIPKIKEFLVTTNVANRFAETTIISKVENSDDYSKQTAFSVVLPQRAYISGFNMEIDGKKYSSFVKEKEEARRLFGQFMSTGQTAGHVSVSTRYSNRFTINVNIEPKSKVIFSLNYEELLQRENGQYEVITNIQPGQIVKVLKVEVRIRESLPLRFVRTPYLRSGSNSLISHNANLDPHARIKLLNTSAWIIFEPDISRQLEFACAGLGNKEYDGFAGQFVVKYDVDRSTAVGETIYQDGILLSFFAPSTKSFDPLPKHIVFVLDRSGSMDGLKMSQLKGAMSEILTQLNHDDLVSIVHYDTNVYVWDIDLTAKDIFYGKDPETLPYGNLEDELKDTYFPPAFPATEENIEKIKSQIQNLNVNSYTNSIGALEVGLLLIKKTQLSNPNKYLPLLVFLTDGIPNVGVELADEILRKIKYLNTANYNIAIYSICFGDDSDWNFLNTLSLQSQDGFATKIPVDVDSYNLLKKFYQSISVPILSNVTINSPNSEEATKTDFSIFYNGTEIVFAAKGVSKENAHPLSISAKAKEGPVNIEAQLGIPLTKLEKVYAYIKVKQLADQYQATGNTNISKLALSLALNYSLVSDFTSLVVVKPDSEGAVDTEDALLGIFPELPNELPLCENITDWIINNYGTTEPAIMTTDFTTDLWIPNDINELEIEGTTTTSTTTTTTETTTTVITTPSTTPTTTTTTEKIITCKESTFGCCFDNVTFAPGPNADGCDPIPRSESCSLPVNEGPCSNKTLKWFYSTKKHKCALFKYGGCGGNGNRYSTKQICESTCISPPSSERCKLPISLGYCNKKQLYWFYNNTADECVKYMYGGCFGNSNRFPSKQKCLKLCSPNKLQITLKNACFQPKDKGYSRCRRFEKNYYFDRSSGSCLKFWFTGCGGNDNRFTSRDVCEKMCMASKNKAY